MGDLHHEQFASRSRMYVWQRSVTIVAKLARGSAPAPQAHVFECFCVAIFSARVSGEMFLLFCCFFVA